MSERLTNCPKCHSFNPHMFKRYLEEEADYVETTPNLSGEYDGNNSCWPGDESQKDICEIVSNFNKIIGLARHSEKCELRFYLLITENHQDRGYKSPQYGYIHYLFFDGSEEDVMNSINFAESKTRNDYKERQKEIKND